MGIEAAIIAGAVSLAAAGASYYQSEKSRAGQKKDQSDARKAVAQDKTRTDQQAAARFAALRARALSGVGGRNSIFTSPSGAAPSAAPASARPSIIGG